MASAILLAAIASSTGRETHPMKRRVDGGVAEKRLTLLDILGEVNPQGSESDLLISGVGSVGRPAEAELLEDLKLDPAFCEIVVPVDGYPQGN